MKKIVYLLSISICIVSCASPTLDTSKPDNVPEWVRWGTYEHNAYNDGRMHFNEDSSIILIVPERAKYNETSTSLIDTDMTISR
jgi:hypothetical protein